MVVLHLQVNRLDDILILDVFAKIVDQIVATDRRVVAKDSLEHFVLQPRIASGFQIVQVMMGIDDRQVVHVVS